MIRLSVRKKLLLSYLLLGLPLTFYVILIIKIHNVKNGYFFILGLTLTTLFSIISGNHITNPLSALRNHLENASNLDFKKVNPIQTGDEFELFFKKFNQMKMRLKYFTESFKEKKRRA